MEDNVQLNIFQNSSISDYEFCTFYLKAAKKLLDFEERSNSEYLNRYYKFFRNHFNIDFGILVNPEHPDYDGETLKLLQESLHYRVVYVLRNSSLLSSAVAFHFQHTLKEDSSYLRRILAKKSIKICSVGGGAASDVVAVVKILDSLAIKMDTLVDFRITIIDSDANWKNTCLTVLSCLKYFHGATWKINFIPADISDESSYSAEVITSIQEADIVLMVMLLLDFINAKKDAVHTVKVLSELLRCDSMLFVLDLALIEHIRTCFGISGETQDYRLVYENPCDFHILEDAARNHLFVSYKKYFTDLYARNFFRVFVRSWIKTEKRERHDFRKMLRHRLKNNIENYNPISALHEASSETWDITYVDRKQKAGWNERFINESLQRKKMELKYLLEQLIRNKELLESTKNELVDRNSQLAEEDCRSHEIDAQTWEKYIIQKKDYAELKCQIFHYLAFGQKNLCFPLKG